MDNIEFTDINEYLSNSPYMLFGTLYESYPPKSYKVINKNDKNNEIKKDINNND